ncbi:MAG TPA: metallophosphoesterase [Dehalococcoidia bacterium]|nr:metallophosphoesterase [Dehalococcoidia bacterium]
MQNSDVESTAGSSEQQGHSSELLLAHSSDLHIGNHSGIEDLGSLRSVIQTSVAEGADALVLAGDIFDHNRLRLEVLDAAARLLGDAPIPVVVLPGNHDCLVPSSVYRRGGIGDPDNVYVFGVTDDDRIEIPELGLGFWGKPHVDYGSMSPLRDAPVRFAEHQVAVAHGHWLEHGRDEHRSWLITSEEMAAVDADYIALGHWDRATPAGDGSTPAYYSGSPDLAGTLNLAGLNGSGADHVRRVKLLPWGKREAADLAREREQFSSFQVPGSG